MNVNVSPSHPIAIQSSSHHSNGGVHVMSNQSIRQQQQQHLSSKNNKFINKHKRRSQSSSSSSSISTCIDLRRIKKISRIQRKIRAIEQNESRELKIEIEKLLREKDLSLSRLRDRKCAELKEAETRYEIVMDGLKKTINDKKKLLQDHCLRELQRIKNRIQNIKKIPQTFIMSGTHKDCSGRIVIKLRRSVKYRNSSIQNDINDIFNNWCNEINFNNKRMTRTATKNKKGSRSHHASYGCTGSYDLQRIRFHLHENEVRSDLKQLLAAEQMKLGSNMNNDNDKIEIEKSITPRVIPNSDYDSISNGGGGGSSLQSATISYEDFMEEANMTSMIYCHGYNGHHIGRVTERLGPLNDPWNVLRSHHPRRIRKPAVYYNNDDNDNSIMYHSQDAQFSKDENIINKMKNNNIDIPNEELGNVMTVDGFTIYHGSLVRINYLSNNITIDARVVSIKKNQLSAKSIVGSKRKRVWYKDLRVGKINIVPARAYT